MKFLKNFNIDYRAVLALLVVSFFLIPLVEAKPRRQLAFVNEVLSGDTLRLRGGKTLKYIGLKAPPLQSRVLLTREYGAKSLEFNRNLVEGKKIWIEWDAKIRDKNRNLLAYVFLEDGTFINGEIIEAGHAKWHLVVPNLKYAKFLQKIEMDARRNKRGVWEKEPDDPFLQTEFIGEKHSQVYYLPTSPELDNFPRSSLVKFKSRVEATAAGYKPCFECKGLEGKEPVF